MEKTNEHKTRLVNSSGRYKIYNKIRIRDVIFFVTILLSILSAGFFGFLNYYNQKTSLINGLDKQLFTAANMAKGTLPDDYHDRIIDSSSVSRQNYLKIVGLYNNLCKTLEMEYLWSLIEIEGEIHFTSGTSTSKTISKGDFAEFFELHSNPELYTKTFHDMVPNYQTNDDKWGRIRVVLVPFLDNHGRKYLFGASIKTTDVDAALNKTLVETLLISGGLLIAVFIASIFLSRFLSRPIEKFIQTTKEIASGNFDQQVSLMVSKELIVLSESINHMNLEIKEKLFELKNREENLRTTLDSIGDAVIVTDIESRVTRMNPVAEKLTGWSLEEARGLPLAKVFKIINTLNRERVENPIGLVISTGKIVGLANHTTLISRDGAEIHISDSAAPIRLSGMDIIGVVLVFRDVTNEYKMREQIRESEEKFKSIVANSPELIMLTNPDGITVYLSPNIEEIIGHSFEKIIGNRFPNIIYIEDLEKCRLKWNQVIVEGSDIKDFEYRIIDQNGKIRWISHSSRKMVVDSKVLGVLNSIQNITERKEAEEILKQSELRFRELFDGAPIGYHEIDTEGRIVQVNKTELNMLGYQDSEMINHYIWEFIIENELSEQIAKAKLRGDETPGKSYERTYRRKDGVGISVLIEDVLLRGTNNEIVGIRSTIQDISDRKVSESALLESNRRLEETLTELRETQRQVLQQERLRAIGQMASGIAHDINNSLSPILGFSDLLLNRKGSDKTVEKYLRSIKTASLDIKRTIERMREFYRPQIEEEEFSNLNLNKIILNTLDLTKHRWKDIAEQKGKVISIQLDFQENLPDIRGNESEIREALTNLIINASDAMIDGGSLLFRSFSENQSIILELQDTGIGMDKETLNHCMDPFFTTKGDQGTGLGLSMVYGIMQRHKGKIEMESEKNKGTITKLHFPLGGKREHEIINDSISTIQGLKVLCIDDNNDIREVLFSFLSEEQQRVDLAEGGKIGLEMFFDSIKKNEPYDIVITDLGMPYMDGKSVSESIKAKSPDTPVILMTGWGAFIEKDSINSVDYILKKPITLLDLNRAIRAVLKIE